MNKGILVVSFGTTYRDTREKNIEALVQDVRNAYPDWEVRQAYSSDIVRKVLRERDQLMVSDIKEALLQMKTDGIHKVVLMPTHVINGIENHKMKRIAKECESYFSSLSVAGALLEAETDYEEVAEALWEALREQAEGRTLILMGHGSDHEADGSYGLIEQAISSYAGEDIFIATVEGEKRIFDAIACMKEKEKVSGRRKEVLLAPFMLVAGDHARNDMAGEEDSFANILMKEGYKTICLMKGLGEYKQLRRVYLGRLRKIIEEI